MNEIDIRIMTQFGIGVGAYLVGMWITFIYLGIKNARDSYHELDEIEWFIGVLWPFALVLLTYSFMCKAFSWFCERIPGRDWLLKVLGVLTIPFRPYRFGQAVGRFFMGVSGRRDGK